jgi:hypothetical protein
MITTILAMIGGAVLVLAVIVGISAWLLSGLKPGDLP